MEEGGRGHLGGTGKGGDVNVQPAIAVPLRKTVKRHVAVSKKTEVREMFREKTPDQGSTELGFLTVVY